jgi:bacteriorhodopsin
MLYRTAYYSLIFQFIVGMINVYGLNLDIPDDKKIFKDILKLEFGVQIIEFIFYIWMIFNIELIKNITPYRYLDWLITTPSMLITLTAFLNNKKYSSLSEYLSENKLFVVKIILLNLIMLLFGLAGELNYMDYDTAILFGFIPFVYYFKMIYDKYLISNPDSNKVKLYWLFLVIWGLYGVSAILPYELKNSSYNILDLFSKNLFSVILVIVILNMQKNNKIPS